MSHTHLGPAVAGGRTRVEVVPEDAEFPWKLLPGEGAVPCAHPLRGRVLGEHLLCPVSLSAI